MPDELQFQYDDIRCFFFADKYRRLRTDGQSNAGSLRLQVRSECRTERPIRVDYQYLFHAARPAAAVDLTGTSQPSLSASDDGLL